MQFGGKDQTFGEITKAVHHGTVPYMQRNHRSTLTFWSGVDTLFSQFLPVPQTKQMFKRHHFE